MFGQCPYCGGNLTNGHDCPQRREAWKEMGLKHGSKTKLTIQTRFESQMGLDAAVEMGFNAGWTQALDRVAAELEKR